MGNCSGILPWGRSRNIPLVIHFGITNTLTFSRDPQERTLAIKTGKATPWLYHVPDTVAHGSCGRNCLKNLDKVTTYFFPPV